MAPDHRTPMALDKAWEAINALGGTADKSKPYDVGFATPSGRHLRPSKPSAGAIH